MLRRSIYSWSKWDLRQCVRYMGVGKIPKLGTCELFFSFTGAFDQLLGIEVPQASKTSVHCCYVQLSQNILSYTTYLPDCIPKLSRVFIACGMTGIGNSLERRLHTVVASLTQHGRYAFYCFWETLGLWELGEGCMISGYHSSASMC